MIGRLDKLCKRLTIVTGKKYDLVWEEDEKESEVKCSLYNISEWEKNGVADAISSKLGLKASDVTYTENKVDERLRNVEFYIKQSSLEESPVIKKMLLADYTSKNKKSMLSIFCGLCGGTSHSDKFKTELKEDNQHANTHSYRKLNSSI